MSDKSGGDVMQGNAGMQGNASLQGLNSIGTGGAGVLESMGGSAMSAGMATQAVSQSQSQANTANTGTGGSDNVHADTNISI